MADTLSFLDEIEARRAQAPTGAEFAAQFEHHRLDERVLAGELTTGRMAAVVEPPEPVGWEDRVRPRRMAAMNL